MSRQKQQAALVLTRGLPSSGKTTLARRFCEQDPENRIRVNRDDLRQNLFGKYHGLTYPQEQTVTVAQHAAVRTLLQAGKTVIVDDTNLRAKHANAYADMAAELGAKFVVLDVPFDVEQAIAWDKARAERGERAVGENVIREFARRYREPLPTIVASRDAVREGDRRPPQYEPDEDLPEAWLVDIDGTVAKKGDRSPFDWKRVGEDALVHGVHKLVWTLYDSSYRVILVSGRDAVCRPETEAWLKQHEVPYHELHMRGERDVRKDAIVKAEIFWNEIAPRFNVVGVLDDRNQVVRMWRDMGLFCAQVAEGDF